MTSIEHSTGFLVVRTARSMKKILDARLSELGITSSQAHVLSTLNQEDGLPLSSIGKKVFLDKPAITGLADRLEKDGLVERRRTSIDRRVIRLFLTSKGKAVITHYETVIQEIDNDIVSALSTDELSEFRNILNKVWQNNNESTLAK